MSTKTSSSPAVRTFKNEEVIFPNSTILGGQILNYSSFAKEDGFTLNTTVTIGYDAPWRKVHEIMLEAARRTDGVKQSPEPYILQKSLNDFHVSYQLNAYSDRPEEWEKLYSRLHQNIQDCFNEAGVEIMSPTFLGIRDGNTVTTPETTARPVTKLRASASTNSASTPGNPHRGRPADNRCSTETRPQSPRP